ncbi:hypothetical protein [Vulcanisaeta moutnovskia]|nr:hypothetical protein [Vulcanisaeta moutnovskia]
MRNRALELTRQVADKVRGTVSLVGSYAGVTLLRIVMWMSLS